MLQRPANESIRLLIGPAWSRTTVPAYQACSSHEIVEVNTKHGRINARLTAGVYRQFRFFLRGGGLEKFCRMGDAHPPWNPKKNPALTLKRGFTPVFRDPSRKYSSLKYEVYHFKESAVFTLTSVNDGLLRVRTIDISYTLDSASPYQK